MYTKLFWKDAAERALKTFAQSAVALLTAGSFNIMTVDYKSVLSVAAFAALTSVLTSLASAGTGSTSSASLVVDTKEQTPEA